MKPISHLLIGAFLLTAFMGFADAAYLTAKHYAGAVPPCSLVHGCEAVLTSPYATIGNIPIAAVGAAYYLALFIAGVLYLDSKKPRVLKAAAYLTFIGFIASAILVGLQTLVIKAFCLYCLASAGTSTLLFILGIVILKKLRQQDTMQSTADIWPSHELMKR